MNNHKFSLISLNLRNFATFTDQSIDFNNGFNTIVGETGSGKSLILDALQLIFGARADKSLVRKNCDYTTVEANFECTNNSIMRYFDEIGYPLSENEIIIKRIIYSNGKSKTYLNFQQCPLNTLQKISKRFVDLVGQFENQKLLNDSYQLVLLDQFAGNELLVENYNNSFKAITELNEKLEKLNTEKQLLSQRNDYIQFQLSELSKLNPSPEDEMELKETKENIVNKENRQNSLSEIDILFNGDDTRSGITQYINKVERHLVDVGVSETILEQFYNTKESLSDLSFNIGQQLHSDDEELDLDSVITRLDQYQKLKSKFNTDTNGLIKLKSEFENELQNFNSIDNDITKTKKDLDNANNIASNIADELHDKRASSAKKLSVALTKSIQNLNMKGATLKFEVKKVDKLISTGLSKVSFLAETNPGEGMSSVKKIASGGELSRILLTIRQILSCKDSISIFLFDEIDTGVGGETALCIGKALAEVAFNSQVIAITHLPQIASYSSSLVSVNKESIKEGSDLRTVSQVNIFSGEQLKNQVKLMTPLLN